MSLIVKHKSFYEIVFSELPECARRIRLGVNDSTSGINQCLVYNSKGSTWAASATWIAQYSDYVALCGPFPGRYPSEDVLKIACESAHDHCANDSSVPSCMVDYIEYITSNGYIELCRSKFNLLTLTPPGQWGWSAWIATYKTSGERCIMYCV